MRRLAFVVYYAALVLLVVAVLLALLCLGFAAWARDAEPARIALGTLYPMALSIVVMWIAHHVIEMNPRT